VRRPSDCPAPGTLKAKGETDNVLEVNDKYKGKGAVFLDRDGTLIEDVNYLRKKEEIRLLPGAAEAVRLLNRSGIPAIIITNQSAVARGWLTEKEVLELQAEVDARFREAGARFDAVYFCPHHPEIGDPTYRMLCSCRKPQPGMIRKAAREWGIDPGRSVMIGDSPSDVEAGFRAGCRSVLVRSKDNSAVAPPAGDADFVASDILEAIKWALEKTRE